MIIDGEADRLINRFVKRFDLLSNIKFDERRGSYIMNEDFTKSYIFEHEAKEVSSSSEDNDAYLEGIKYSENMNFDQLLKYVRHKS
jgi:hypothetical protein